MGDKPSLFSRYEERLGALFKGIVDSAVNATTGSIPLTQRFANTAGAWELIQQNVIPKELMANELNGSTRSR